MREINEIFIKPHGYSINLQALAKNIGKRYGVDTDGVIKKRKRNKLFNNIRSVGQSI